jgi:hypothetical protein
MDGEDLITAGANVNEPFVPSGQEDWEESSFNSIVSVFLNSSFRVRFEFVSENGNNIYIDDINLQDANLVSTNEILSGIKNSLKVYPNPASNQANIEIDQVSNQSNIEIVLMDLSGRTIKPIYSGNLSSSQNKWVVELNDLSNGIYFVRFKTSEGVFAEKIVVGNVQ